MDYVFFVTYVESLHLAGFAENRGQFAYLTVWIY